MPTSSTSIRAGEMAERTIVGSIDQIVDEVGGYVELGFDEFIVPDFGVERRRTPSATANSSNSSPP